MIKSWWFDQIVHEDQEFLPDQLDGDRTITQAPTPRAPLAWQAVTSGGKKSIQDMVLVLSSSTCSQWS